MSYAIIGYSCDLGGPNRGAASGPDTLRQRGLLKCFSSLNKTVVDLGNVTAHIPSTAPAPSKNEATMHNTAEVYSACKSLYDKTTQALEDKQIPIVLGGDHSSVVGSFAAVSDFYQKQNKKIGLIYIDAHPDINTWESSTSRCIYGTTVAVLSGLAPGCLASLQKIPPALELSSVCYLGLRDVDPKERALFASKNINAFSIKEIDRYGMGYCIEKAIEIASKGTDGIFVSFDLDACDPQIVPGTPLQIRGGITFRESHLALEMLYDTGKVIGFEIAEFSPALDNNDRTSDFCLSLIESIIGKSIL